MFVFYRDGWVLFKFLSTKLTEFLWARAVACDKGFLAAKKWTWPMLLALSQNYQQFNEIKKVLKVATPRIISTRLSELEHIQLVEKSWIQGESIKPIYILEANQSPIIHQAKEQLLKII